jgi:hypothetical protein
VFEFRVIGVPAQDFDPFRSKRSDDLPLHGFLRRPAGLICCQTQIATGNQYGLIGADWLR